MNIEPVVIPLLAINWGLACLNCVHVYLYISVRVYHVELAICI